MSNNHGIIKFRRGTAAEWANSWPPPGGEVLRLGEPGFEKDTYKLKIGDGITPWNDLPYIAGGIGGTGGPLVYIYDTDFSSTSISNSIKTITISAISNSVDFFDYFQDLLDNNKSSSIRISSVDNQENFVILNADPPSTSGSDFTFNTTQVVNNNLELIPDSAYYINIDILGSADPIDENIHLKVCSLELGGNAFFAGDPVTIYQENSENQVFDAIDVDLTLTRGSESYEGGGGLYNSELQTDYSDNGDNGPAGTEWNADGWATLSDVQFRNYDTLHNVLDGAVGQNITNAELVMHDTINDKYYKFDFTYWQPGAGQQVGPTYPIGGFKYTRTLLWVQPEPVTFVRASNETNTVDIIDDGLIIKRSSSGGGGIYNSVSETGWDVAISPSGTLWNIEGWDNLSNVAEREYVSFYAATGGQLGNNVENRQYVMHDTINDKYYTIQFTNWGGGGQFSYIRQQINGYCAGNIKFGDGTIQDTAFTEALATDIALDVVNNSLNTSLVAGSGIDLSYASGILTIKATGLALSSHSHVSTDITDFTEAAQDVIGASGFLVPGTGITVSYDDMANTLTVGTSGLALTGHTHTASNITDFNSAVSGLLPVKDIQPGTGISISSTSGVYTITSTGSGVYVDQAASLVTTVFNETGSPIPKMTVVYIDGGHGDRPTVSPALATGDPTSAGTYGITYENIPNMETGRVVVFGALTGVNTDPANGGIAGATEGSVLYLSPTVPGGITTTKPSAPNHIVSVGVVVRVHQNQGVIEVKIINGFELEELHNVAISGVANNQILVYSSGNSLWQNSSIDSILPTIANSGDNRILTSTGTSTGVNAESNMTFNGTSLVVSGNAKFTQVHPTVSDLGNVSGSVGSDISTGQIFDLTVTGATTLSNPTNPVDGVTVRWRILQDGVGSHSVALDTKFNIPSSATTPLAWSTAPNTMDILAATYHAGRDKWDIVAFVPGY